MYGYATTSWYLAESVSYIELNTEKISDEEVAAVEEAVNQKIRDATAVHIVEYNGSDPKLKEVSCRFINAYIIHVVTFAE